MTHVRTIFFLAALALLSFQASAQIKEDEGSGVVSTRVDATHVSVYPNPAIEYLYVKFDEPIARKSRLTVHNIIGNVLEVESEAVDEHEIRLKVKDLPIGYYVLAVGDAESSSRSIFKFLKR